MNIDTFPESEIISPQGENNTEIFNNKIKETIESFLNLDPDDEDYDSNYSNLVTEFSNLDSDKEIFQQKQRLSILKNHLDSTSKELNLLQDDRDNLLEDLQKILDLEKTKYFLDEIIKQIEARLSSIDKVLLEDSSKRIEEASAVSKEYVVGEYVDIEGKRYERAGGAEVKDDYYARRVDIEITPNTLIDKYKKNIEWYLEKKKDEYEQDGIENPFENNDIEFEEIKTYKDMERVWNKIQALGYPKMKLDEFYLNELRGEKKEEFDQVFNNLDEDIFFNQRKEDFEAKLKKVETFEGVENIKKEFINILSFDEKQSQFNDFYKRNIFKIDDFDSFKDDYIKVLVKYDLDILRERVKRGGYSYETKLIENDKKISKLNELKDKLEKSESKKNGFLYKWAEKIVDNNLDNEEDTADSIIQDEGGESIDDLIIPDERGESIDDLIIPDEREESVLGKFKLWVANKIIESREKDILDNLMKEEIEDKKDELEKEIQKNEEFFNTFDDNFEKSQKLWNKFASYSSKITLKNYKKYNEEIRKDIEERYQDAVIPNYLVIDGERREINFRKSYQEDLTNKLNLVKEEYIDDEFKNILEKIPRLKTYNDIKKIKEEILNWKNNKSDEMDDQEFYNPEIEEYERKIEFASEEMDRLGLKFDRLRKLVDELDEIQKRLENPSWWDFWKSNKISYYNEDDELVWVEFKRVEEIDEFKERNEINEKYKNYKDKFVIFRIADI